MKTKVILSTIITLLALALIVTFVRHRDVRNKLLIAQHNISAAQDSIRYLKDANGKLYAEKKSFIASVAELKELNREMHENIQSLKRETRRKLLAGTDIGMVVRDTIIRDNIVKYTLDSLVDIRFADETIRTSNLVRIHRDSVYLQQFSYELDIPLEVYFTKDYQVIARSKHKNITFNRLNSFIDPSVTKYRARKRWGLGIQAGVGVMPTYDSAGKSLSMKVGPYVGIGVSYQILQW